MRKAVISKRMAGRLSGSSAEGRAWSNSRPGFRAATRKAGLTAAAASVVALFAAPMAHAANTEYDVTNGQTDLTAAATYTTGGAAGTGAGGTTAASAPGLTSDVTFDSIMYSPAAFTINGSGLTFGSLNDLSGTPLTIANTGTALQTLTLGGTADPGSSVPGASLGDLLYVNSGASLTLNGGSGNTALGLALGQNGNFDINGSASIGSIISGPGFGFTKTGSGTLTLNGANTYSGTTLVSTGTLAFTADQNLSGGLSFGTAPSPATKATSVATTNANVDFTAANGVFGGALVVQTNSNTPNTMTIGGEKTVSFVGLTMGLDVSSTLNTTNTGLTVSGAGELDVTGTAVQIGVSQSTGNSSNNNYATLDLSGLARFTAAVTNFNVGVGNDTGGVLRLANTSNSITANTLTVGNSTNNNPAPANSNGSLLYLGAGANLLNVDTLNIGLSKASSTVQFAGSSGSITIAGDTNAAANIVIGSRNGTAGTGYSPVALLNLAGHSATITADAVTIGQDLDNTAAGSFTGALNFDTGTFTANTLSIGTLGTPSGTTATANVTGTLSMGGGVLTVGTVGIASKINNTNGTGGTGTAFGTINLSGGTFTVNSGFTLGGNSSSTGKANGTLNITGGVFDSNVNILSAGGTSVTTTLTLNGGTLDLHGHSIGDSSNPITNLNFQSGALQNVLEINGGADLNKTGGGTLVLAGTNHYTGATNVTAGTLSVTGTFDSTSGLSVSNGAVFNYLPAVAGTLNIGSSGGLTLAAGSTVGLAFGDTIHAPGSATTSAGTVYLNLSGPFTSGQAYTLLAADGGDLSTTAYSVLNATNYTYALNKSASAVSITPTTAAALSQAYWLGGVVSGAGQVWSASNLGGNSNWTTDGAGAATTLVPGAGTDVFFADASATAANQSAMTLGSNMAINSLTIDGSAANPHDANPVTLNNTGGFTLTIGNSTPTGTPGITVNAGSAAVTLNANVAMGTAQSWTNNSGSLFKVAGNIDNGGNLLTLAGSGTPNATMIALTGAISGSGGLWDTYANSASLTSVALSGPNTYTGPTSVFASTSTFVFLSFNTIGNVNGGASALGNPSTVANGTINIGSIAGSRAALVYTGTAASSSDRVINMTGNGNVQIYNTGTGALTLTGGVTATDPGTPDSQVLVFRGGGTITESGLIATGGAALNFTDGGNWFLTNDANSFTGQIQNSTGVLHVTSIADSGVNSAIGAGSKIVLGQNTAGGGGVGTLVVTGPAGGSSNRAILINNGATGGAAVIQNSVANTLLTLSGAITTTTPASASTLTLNGVGNGLLSGSIAGSPKLAVTMSGSGTWTLTGTDTFTGATTVNSGVLQLGLGGSLSGTSVTVNNGGTFAVAPATAGASNTLTGSIRLNPGGTLSMVDGATNTFTVTASSPLNPISGSSPTIAFEIGGASGTNDQLVLNAAPAAGFVGDLVSIHALPGTTSLTPSAQYTLITAPGGLDSGLFGLASNKLNVNGTTYVLGLSTTPTAAVLNVLGASTLAQAYWTGLGGATWGATTNSGATTNWSTDPSGTPDAQGQPDAGTDVFFTATGVASSVSTSLGANVAINNLNFTAASPAVTVAADGHTLSLNGSSGITVASGSAAQTINADLALNNVQTWANASSNLLTVGGAINNGGHVLSTSGSGNFLLSGPVSGAAGFNAFGTGTVTLAGANTYTGPTSATGGTLVLSGSSNTSSITIDGGTNTTLLVTNPAATGSGLIITNSGATTPMVQFHINGGGVISLPNAIGGNSGITTTYDVNNNGDSSTGGVIQLNGALATSAIGTVTMNITGGNGYSLFIANLRSTAGGAGTYTINPTTASVSIGNITGTQGTGTNTWALGGTAQGNSVVGTISNGGAAAGAVAKSGTSTWTLSGVNTYTGATSVTGGTLTVAGSGSLHSGNYAGAISISSGASLVFNTSAGQILTGAVSGAGNFTQAGPGTLTLKQAAVNTFTGNAVVNGGTLALDFTALATPTDLLNNATTLTLGGGTLRILGNASSDTSQTVASLTLVPANTASSIVLVPDAAGSLNTSLTITSNIVNTSAGATLNINYTAGSTNGASVGNDIVNWNPLLTNGIIGPGYTVTDAGGTGFATVVGGQVVRLAPSDLLPPSGADPTINYVVNVDGDSTTPGSLNLAQTASQTANTVSVDTTANSGTVTLGDTILSTNGFTIGGSTTNTFSIASSAAGGIKAASAGGNLTITNSAAGVITFAAGILDNTTSSLTVAGSRPLVLTGTNTYAGPTTIASGATLQIGGGGTLGAGTYAGTISNSGALVYNSTAAQTLSGVISGTGSVTQLGTGTLTLAAANTYSGKTIIDQGTLAMTVTPNLTGALVFGASPASPNFGGLDLSTASAAFSSLTVQNSNAAANTVTLGTGQSLTINGPVNIGTSTVPAGGLNSKLSVTGGTFTANLGAGALNIGTHIATGTPTGVVAGVLDLSGTAAVNIVGSTNASSILLGSSTVNDNTHDTALGTLDLSLAGANTVSVGTITLGQSPGSGQTGIQGFIVLGNAANNFNVDTVYVARQKSAINGSVTDSIKFAGTGGTLTLNGFAGVPSKTTLRVGYNDVGGTGTVSQGTMDLTGGTFNAQLGAVTLGFYPTNTGGGGGKGTLIIPAGTVTVDSVVMANAGGSTNLGNNAGTLTLSGGSVTFNSGGSGITSNTTAAHSGAAVINLSGTGLLEMSNQPVTTDGANSKFNFTGGTFSNVSTFSVAGSTNLTNNGGLVQRTVPGTTTIGVLNFTAPAAALSVSGGTFSTTGITTTDSNATVTVNGGTLDLNANAIGGATPINNLNFQSGTIQNVSEINAGATPLNKTGPGTLALTSTGAVPGNTYTGGTNVNAGTLLANSIDTTNGSTGLGLVNVLAGAKLGGGTAAGPGQIRGSVTVAGKGVVSAGDAALIPGKLNIAGVTTLTQGDGTVGGANSGSAYLWKISNATGAAGAANGWDQLSFTQLSVASAGAGNVVTVEPLSVGGGTLNQAMANFSSGSNYTWLIASAPAGSFAPATGGLAANFALDVPALSSFAAANGVSPDSFALQAEDNGASLDLVYTSAPEPSSLGLLTLGAGALLARRRRRGRDS